MNSLTSVILNLIAFCIAFYMVFVLVRLFSYWFPSAHKGGFVTFTFHVTEPWLKIFRRIKFFQYKGLDLSPIPAVIVLQVIMLIFLRLAQALFITFGYILAIVISLTGEAAGLIFLLLAIIALLRILAILFRANQSSRLWMVVDNLMQPLVYQWVTKLFPRRVIPYGSSLAFFAGSNAIFWFVVRLVTAFLVELAFKIPF